MTGILNTRILASLAMIVFVAAAAAGGTGAFFSDTETSTGNTFTAGAIDLTVDSEQHYNEMVCSNQNGFGSDFVWIPNADVDGVITPDEAATYNAEHPLGYPKAGTACTGTWAATNLGAHKFFNFDDVKPGDMGENTISLHVDSNDAFACVDVSITQNDDESSTEPELEAPDVAEDVGNLFDGELAQNLNFFAWVDDGAVDGLQNSDNDQENNDAQEGDNIWQVGELPLFQNPGNVGPASDVLGGVSYTLADGTTGPLSGNTTHYIGLAWCAGSLTAVAGVMTCDGATMGNITQTDSLVADIAFRVEQARNNPNFRCTPPVTEPVVTTLTLAKTVLTPDVEPDSSFTLIATGPTPISGIEGALSVTNFSITPGVYTLSETGGQVEDGTPVVTWQCTGNATPEVNNIDDTATVTIAAGESVVCDATNDYTQQ